MLTRAVLNVAGSSGTLETKVIKLSARRAAAPAALAPGRTALAAAVLIAAGLTLAACGTATSPSSPAGTGSRPATSPSTPSAPTAPSTPAAPAPGAGFGVLSMSFVSDTEGFALGTTACGGRRCLALLTTTDGGAHWRALNPPPARPGSAYDTCPAGGACVQQIRFATPQVGYAFGPALFVTTDGGAHWRRLAGANVSSLETAGGTAVRVVSGGEGCAGQRYQVQSAPDGTAAWRTLNAPPIQMICQPVLYRQGSRLVLAGYGNPAGGVRATAQVERSADGGSTWTGGSDRCGGNDGYAAGVALAPPDVLVLLCQHQRPEPDGFFKPAYLRISANAGATFGPDHPLPALPRSGGYYRYQIAAASAARILVTATGVHGSVLLTSQNGGRSWATTLTMPSTARVVLVGFEDPLTARITQANTVWTTTNGARTWHADRFTS